MNSILIPSLYLVAGVCAYATANHLSVALRRPFDSVHLLFAGMSLLMIPFAFSHAVAWQATDIAELVTALKWNLSVICLFVILFVWFIAEYTGTRPLVLLVGFSVVVLFLFVVNLAQPYSLQYDEITGLSALHLPWGEVLTRPIGHNGIWTYIAVATVLVVFGYAFHALRRLYRRERSYTALLLMFAVGGFVISSIDGILARLSVINFIELGPFGYLVVVIAMSAILNHETRLRQRESERRFRSLVEQSPFSIQILSPDGKTQQVNDAWEKLWGIKAENLARYNILQDRQLAEKGAMPYIQQAFAGQAAAIPPLVYNPAESPEVRGPVRNRWVRAFIYPIKDETGAVRDVILMHEDVTEHKRVEDAIRNIATGVSGETGEVFFQQLVLSLARLFDADYAFIGVLDEHDALRVNTLAVCAHGAIAPDIGYPLNGTPCANVLGQGTCTYPHGVQHLFPEDRLLAEMGAEGYMGTPLFDAQGKPLGVIVVLDSKPLQHIEQVQEILEIFAARAGSELQRLRAETHIRRLAYQDYLTGLASRAHLHERLSVVLRQLRLSQANGALLLIDLDHFKTINDALGHDIGDEVLRAVARRLSDAVGERAFVARLGGDEFAVLLDNHAAEHEARGLAQKILDKLSGPVFVGERALSVGASIGVVLFPENGESELDVLRHADMALYRAKNLGRSNIQFYLPSLQVAAASRLSLEEGLRQAIGNKEMELYFQPQVNADGRMIGAEALLRWHHPELGDVPPGIFIPVAEETGLIHAIGNWVFDQVCARIADWTRRGLPFQGHLAVNVCPWQFSRPDFLDLIRHTLEKHDIDPDRLMLELTETALLHDLAETIKRLKALRALGIRISLDDFGTGYSSLSHLQDLPLDEIKIDKAFVSELDATQEHPLVESMIAIGLHMKLAVIAEGVETEAQHAALLHLGCEYFQGFLFARPLPETDFLDWLSQNR